MLYHAFFDFYLDTLMNNPHNSLFKVKFGLCLEKKKEKKKKENFKSILNELDKGET